MIFAPGVLGRPLLLPRLADKFLCPRCESFQSRVIDSRPDEAGLRVVRCRECIACHHRFYTGESVLTRVAVRALSSRSWLR